MKQRLSLVLAVILIGIATGLGAAFLSWFIHGIEYVAFGHSETEFRIVTDHTTPVRRFIAMMIGGLIVAISWWLLQTRGRPVVGLTAAIKAETREQKHPPFFENTLHALLQIVAVGVGAPVGREVAPRELGALFAGRIADCFTFDADTRRALVACGAAAGLAGVYNVPFAGAIFALEILLGSFSVRYAAISFGISAIAVLVAHIEISTDTFYQLGQISDSWQLTLWAAAVGLLVGYPAAWFRKVVKKVEAERCKKRQVLWAMPLAFFVTAIAAIWLPEILGNGRSVAQTAYWGTGIAICFGLLVAKTATVLITLRSGVYGGTLTPGLAIGAILGLFIGLLAQLIVPETSLLTAALAGSAGFLAVSMNAPFSAFALIVGFTGQGFNSYLPLSLAVGAAFVTASLVKK